MVTEGSAVAVRAGQIAAGIATLVAPLAIFLALPPFYNGIWVQVEGAMPWLHGVAALAAAGCGAMAWGGEDRAVRALTHPLVVIPALLFAVSVLLLPMTTLPALSLLGAPEHGFGASAYLDLAALTAAALVACAAPVWRRAVLVVVFAVIGGAFTLDALFRGMHSWAPFFFGDYLAFYAVFAFAILGVLTRGKPALFALASALCLVLALLSSNKAAILALGGALLLLPIVLRDSSRRTAVALTLLVPIGVGLSVILVGSAWAEDYRDWLLKMTGYGPIPALIVDSWASMWSRAMLVVVGAQSFFDAPWRLLVGFGWGHYNESLLANLPIVEGRFHEYIGPSQVYWDAIRRVDFHSHNQYFEALLSAGLAGAALFLAYGTAWVLSAPPSHRRLALVVALLLATLQSFWFQMPHTLPVMAIAAAMLCGSESRRVVTSPLRRCLLPVSGLAAAAILLPAGIMAGIASSNVRAALADIDLIASGYSEGPLQRGFAAGLGEIYDATLEQHAYARLKSEPNERGLDILNVFLARAGDGPPPRSLKLAISTANLLSGVVFALPEYLTRYGSPDIAYRRAVEQVIRQAPRRSDIAIPYFNRLLATGRETEALALANGILARHRNDAVALWFSGIVLLGNPATAAAGMQNLKQSLAGGIRNLMPVDDAVIRAVEQ